LSEENAFLRKYRFNFCIEVNALCDRDEAFGQMCDGWMRMEMIVEAFPGMVRSEGGGRPESAGPRKLAGPRILSPLEWASGRPGRFIYLAGGRRGVGRGGAVFQFHQLFSNILQDPPCLGMEERRID
jgi:hypothetical protein